MKQAAWDVRLDGQIVDINSRLLSLSITDNRGLEADCLTVVLSDHDGKLRLPPTGRELAVCVGYKNAALVDRGKFIVSEIRHDGPPDQLMISAKSADFSAQRLRAGRKKSWLVADTGGKLGNIVKTIAAAHKLESRIAPPLVAVEVGHIDQTESDAHFLTRLAEENDAIATIKAGRLLFIPTGAGQTASGKALPTVQIQRHDGDAHSFSRADQEQYTGVRAFYDDKRGARRKHVDVGADGYRKHLQRTCATKERAYAAAKASWQRLQRETVSIDLTLADAPPNIFAETPLELSGFNKPEIDGKHWTTTRAGLTINDQGLTGKVNAEKRITETS